MSLISIKIQALQIDKENGFSFTSEQLLQWDNESNIAKQAAVVVVRLEGASERPGAPEEHSLTVSLLPV